MINFLLQTTPASQGGGLSMLIMIGGFILIMYFLMIRPQQKQARATKKFQQELQKGQWVVTIGGVHGRLVEINENTCIIDTKAGQITFERNAISRDMTDSRYGAKATEGKK